MRTRTSLPVADYLLEPALDADLKSKMKYAKSKQAAYYNRNTRDFFVLEEGDVVPSQQSALAQD